MEPDNTLGTYVALVRKSDSDASSAKIWEVEFACSGIDDMGVGIGQRNLKNWEFPRDPHDPNCVTRLPTISSQACLFWQVLAKALLPAWADR